MNPVTKYIIAALIGSSVGFIGGLQGIAGGFYISMLLLATGLVETQRMAAGTTLRQRQGLGRLHRTGAGG